MHRCTVWQCICFGIKSGRRSILLAHQLRPMVPGMRRPNSGLSEFVNIKNQRCHSRLGWDRSRIYFSPTVRLALYIDYVSRALQVSRSQNGVPFRSFETGESAPVNAVRLGSTTDSLPAISLASTTELSIFSGHAFGSSAFSSSGLARFTRACGSVFYVIASQRIARMRAR